MSEGNKAATPIATYVFKCHPVVLCESPPVRCRRTDTGVAIPLFFLLFGVCCEAHSLPASQRPTLLRTQNVLLAI